ncbi:MAG: DUF1648 domain-containing protein [Pyrinomonadaceae bacterium]
MPLSRIIFYLLIGIFTAQTVYYFPALPDKVASHFDGSGSPDGWMSKNGFIVLEVIILSILVFQFVGLPYLIEKLPNSLVNIPNKDYWLATERKAGTFAFIRQYFDWFAVGSLGLFVLVNQLVYSANIERQNLPSAKMWAILIVYFAFVIFWLIRFIRHFTVRT